MTRPPSPPHSTTRSQAALRIAGAVVHALHGLAIVLLRFPRLSAIQRQVRVAWWSRTMLRQLGIGLQVEGAFAAAPQLVVANHVSWLDVLGIHAVCPAARFVSKADVQRWPLLARLVAAGGTLYIERERRRDALRVVHQMAAALRAGATVAVFPEGTTGDGIALLPFHANLLQAAVSAGVPVQPVALRYADRGNASSPAVRWLGDTTLAGSIRAVARADALVLHLRVLPVEPAGADRRALAARLQRAIAAATVVD